ncbi:MAG: capsular polysaccharide synthesis protein, partial [Treponema sp.]|nr:capsular polysaccharide synthesis protein [Treponema sp.]
MALQNTQRILKHNTKILTLSKICYKLHLDFLGRLISRKRVFSTFKTLKNLADPFLNTSYDFENAEIIDSKSSPIFVMWLQGGEDVMPEAVKMCFNSLKKRCNTHPIYLISEKNLAEYIDLPPKINEKFKDGRISRAFFSDIVRASLLYKYGGTWIDSTV